MRQLKCECGVCPVCKSRERQRQYRADPAAVERLRANDRRRYRRDKAKRRAAMDAYGRTERGRERGNVGKRAYKERNPEKVAAHRAVQAAVRAGRLTRGPCERGPTGCNGRVEAHHDDYSKPLNVRWLCCAHHAQLHAGLAA